MRGAPVVQRAPAELPPMLTVRDLALALKLGTGAVISQLFKNGVTATISRTASPRRSTRRWTLTRRRSLPMTWALK
jgi:hypothetical protein